MKAFQFPLIKITIFFAIGIFTAFYWQPKPILALSSLLISFLLFGFVFYKSLKTNAKSLFFGIGAYLLSFLIGLLTQVIHTDLYKKNHFVNQISSKEKEYTIKCSLQEKLKKSINNDRFIAKIFEFNGHKSVGKIIINIRKDSIIQHFFEIGNILNIKASVYKNKPIKNPNQFDYGKYLENKNIYAQAYCDLGDIKISSDIDKNLRYYAAKFREKIIYNLEKNGFAKDELAVVVALILGQQQDISPEIIQDYQFAGAVHILSVSGLHVGFILLFVGYLLKPFPNTKKWKINKLFIVLASLWLFGFIAGLAPSVLRSVVMFSFVAIGRYLGRGDNIYNSLLVSALLILLFEPSFLFDVGFQLSYVSLYFIIWLNPVFATILQPKNRIIKFFWEIITVSFAAQIGAMGLSIYYFHQFPELFFITNLVVLPAMGFILALGVLVMLLAYFDVAPHFLIKILEYSIWILDKIIAYIASFEQFILQNISLNKFVLCTLYLMIFAIIICLKKPDFKRLAIALSAIIIFQVSIISSKYHYQNQKEMIVFNNNKSSLITKRIGQKTILYANKKLEKYSKTTINQYLVANYSQISLTKQLPKLIYFQNKKILIIDSLSIKSININPDILILTHSPKINLDRFLENCKPKIIVADASNFKTYIKVWKLTCQKLNIDFHATSEKGFYKVNNISD